MDNKECVLEQEELDVQNHKDQLFDEDSIKQNLDYYMKEVPFRPFDSEKSQFTEEDNLFDVINQESNNRTDLICYHSGYASIDLSFKFNNFPGTPIKLNLQNQPEKSNPENCQYDRGKVNKKPKKLKVNPNANKTLKVDKIIRPKKFQSEKQKIQRDISKWFIFKEMNILFDGFKDQYEITLTKNIFKKYRLCKKKKTKVYLLLFFGSMIELDLGSKLMSYLWKKLQSWNTDEYEDKNEDFKIKLKSCIVNVLQVFQKFLEHRNFQQVVQQMYQILKDQTNFGRKQKYYDQCLHQLKKVFPQLLTQNGNIPENVF